LGGLGSRRISFEKFYRNLFRALEKEICGRIQGHGSS